MTNFRSNSFSDTPPIVKNLIIINVILFVLTFISYNYYSIDLTNLLGLHYFKSNLFHPWQFITHMFMHAILFQGGGAHIFFNMFALWMFGRVLEEVWGSKRFLIFYMVTGIGAALFYTLVNYFSYSSIESSITAFANTPSPELYVSILRKHFEISLTDEAGFIKLWASNINNPMFIQQAVASLHQHYIELTNCPVVGASGAVFGVLLGFGMLFPNTELFLFFIPVPIKAKWVVTGYGVMELYFGLTQPGSHIAHFAHLGGMLFGFILIKYWKTNRTTFY